MNIITILVFVLTGFSAHASPSNGWHGDKITCQFKGYASGTMCSDVMTDIEDYTSCLVEMCTFDHLETNFLKPDFLKNCNKVVTENVINTCLMSSDYCETASTKCFKSDGDVFTHRLPYFIFMFFILLLCRMFRPCLEAFLNRCFRGCAVSCGRSRDFTRVTTPEDMEDGLLSHDNVTQVASSHAPIPGPTAEPRDIVNEWWCCSTTCGRDSFEVTIPPNLNPNDKFFVDFRDSSDPKLGGRLFVIVVPKGSHGGDSMIFVCPPRQR